MKQSLVTLIWLWLLLLVPLPARSQSEALQERDTLLKMLEGSTSDSSRVMLFLRLGRYYIGKPGDKPFDIDSAYTYAKKAESLSSRFLFFKGYDESQMLLAELLILSEKKFQLDTFLGKFKAGKPKADILLQAGNYYFHKKGELQGELDLLLPGKYYQMKKVEFDAVQDLAEKYTRQALKLNLQLRDNQGQIESLLTLGSILSERNNESQALIYFRQAFALISKIKNLSQRADWLSKLAEAYPTSSEGTPEKVKAYKQALSNYESIGNKEQEAFTLKQLADFDQQQGRLAESLRELLEAANIQKSLQLPHLSSTYDLLVQVYKLMGNYELALPYGLSSIQTALSTHDTLHLILYYSRVAYLYQYLGQPQHSLEMYKYILNKLQREPGNGYSYARWVYVSSVITSMLSLNRPNEALAFIKTTLGRFPPDNRLSKLAANGCLGDVYLYLKDYAKAEQYLLKGLEGDTNVFKYLSGPEMYYLKYYSNLSKLYLKQGKYQKARLYLSEAFHLFERQPDLLQLSKLHLQAFKIDSLQGKLSSAITHFQQYKALEDSVFNERKSNQLIAYQVQYDTEKKERDLQLKKKDIELKEQNIRTLTKERMLQDQRIKQDETVRNIIIGGSVLLILLLGLISYGYKMKRHNNQVLEARQQQLQHQQKEINEKNAHLSELLTEKDCLLIEKDELLSGQQILLAEKERLLKEIHHRVKNNLQVVISLLISQSSSLKDKAALLALQECKQRVHAMALIHQKLYHSDRVARVAMQSYIHELIVYLRESYSLSNRVRIELLVEPIELDVILAVPLGLIINEAITNAFKYAFPKDCDGTLSLSLRRLSGVTCELTISDDGVGLPPNFNPSGSRSLGMTLMHGFSKQLGGQLNITSTDGVRQNLIFNEEQLDPIYTLSHHAN